LRDELSPFGIAEIIDNDSSLPLWQTLRDVTPLVLPAEAVIWRISIAPTDAPALVDTLSRALDLRYFLDWSGGLLWVAVTGAPDGGAAVIRAALKAGHATLIRASDALRVAVPVFQPQAAPVAALSRRVKDSFDPKRLFNRGRMYGDV
jgi:glycolate oxidase FAD binding subunit